MLQLHNLQAEVAGNALLAAMAASLLTACGAAGDNPARESVEQLLKVERVAALLSPEAKAAVESYKRDLRSGIDAHIAQYGRFPQSLAELKSVPAVRDASVSLIADGLAQQVPFASRETVEKAANAFVATAERTAFEQLKKNHAPNP